MNLGTFGFGSSSGGGSGTITGSGNAPKIPKFTAASVIGDSQMSDNGTTVFIGASATSTSAVFEVNSTTKGVLFPRVTTAQRNAITVNAAANSLFVYNTTISQYQYYDHTTTSWKTVDNGLDGIYSGSGTVPAGTTATITDYIAFNSGEFRTQNGYWQGTNKILYINPNGTTANLFVGQSSGNDTMTGIENTGVGYQALLNNTTGFANFAIGIDTLMSNTTGSNNVASGYKVLTNNTVGYNNTGIGANCLFTSVSVSDSVGIGYNCLYSSSDGYQNTAIGNGALLSNVSGGANVAIGYNCLYQNTSGNNVAIGVNVLFSNLTGNTNVAIGYKAAYYETGSNKLFIDNSPRTNEADGRAKALIYGIFDAATTNQYLNINANTNTPLAHYNYMAASNSADTIGDVRTYATYAATVSTFFIEKCTVANATKGGGTWVNINSFSL